MSFSTKTDKSEKSLNYLINQSIEINLGQYLDAIDRKKMSIIKIDNLCSMVSIWHSTLNIEVNDLLEFKSEFNNHYATNHNDWVPTVEMLFRRLAGSIEEAKVIYLKFCPNVRRNFKKMNLQDRLKPLPNVFDRSFLARVSYTNSLFGFDPYPIAVYKLYEELSSANKLLIIGLLTCRDILEEQERISNTPNELRKIFEKCLNDVINNQKLLLNIYLSNKESIPSCVAADAICSAFAKGTQDIALKQYFHKCNDEEFIIISIKEYIRRKKTGNMTDVEKKIWHDDELTAMKARVIMKHFDELGPKGYINSKSGKYRLSGKSVVFFMIWGRIKTDIKYFVEEYFNKTYKGEFELLPYKTIDSARNKQSSIDIINNQEYIDFIERIDMLLTKYGSELNNLAPAS